MQVHTWARHEWTLHLNQMNACTRSNMAFWDQDLLGPQNTSFWEGKHVVCCAWPFFWGLRRRLAQHARARAFTNLCLNTKCRDSPTYRSSAGPKGAKLPCEAGGRSPLQSKARWALLCKAPKGAAPLRGAGEKRGEREAFTLLAEQVPACGASTWPAEQVLACNVACLSSNDVSPSVERDQHGVYLAHAWHVYLRMYACVHESHHCGSALHA